LPVEFADVEERADADLHIRRRDRLYGQDFSESPKREMAPHPGHSHRNHPERNKSSASGANRTLAAPPADRSGGVKTAIGICARLHRSLDKNRFMADLGGRSDRELFDECLRLPDEDDDSLRWEIIGELSVQRSTRSIFDRSRAFCVWQTG
jgi:hypothetical protein